MNHLLNKVGVTNDFTEIIDCLSSKVTVSLMSYSLKYGLFHIANYVCI